MQENCSTSPQRRTLTVTLRADDAEVAGLLEELLAAARLRDPLASGRTWDPVRERAWTELSFVSIDVETTGFSPERDRVLELAWVRFEGGRETERFSSLVSVDADIPEAVRRITGIHRGMLADKPRFAALAPGLCEALASADFAVAYNARFDRGFLVAELARAGLELPDIPWVDPLLFLRGLLERGAPKRLGDAARFFGVAQEQAHRAESDARTTAQLLLRLAPRLPARTLQELVEKQGRWSRLPEPAVASIPSEAQREPSLGHRLRSLFR